MRKEVSSATLSSRHRIDCDWKVFQNKSGSRKDEYQAIQQQVVVLRVIFQTLSCVLLSPLWKCLSHQRVPALATFSPRLPIRPARDVRNIIVRKGRVVFSNTSVTSLLSATSSGDVLFSSFSTSSSSLFLFRHLHPKKRDQAVPCSNQTSPTYKLVSIESATVRYSTELTSKWLCS